MNGVQKPNSDTSRLARDLKRSDGKIRRFTVHVSWEQPLLIVWGHISL